MAESGERLYHIDEVPQHFKEPFLMTGYRNTRSSLFQCLVSIFKPTNETMNFWTHFVFALYFWWKTYWLFQEMDLLYDPFLWPLLAYLITLCIFPLASAIAHVLNTMSDHARHLCFMFDYIALSLYSIGAAIAYKAYVFPEDWMESIFDSAFLYIAFFNALMCMFLSSRTRFMQLSKTRKAMRLAAFAVPYLFDCIPLVYRVLFCRPEDCSSDGLHRHIRQFVFAGMSAFLYASHLPERWYPGKFDIFFHSHQLFHIFSSLGANDQLEGLLIDLKVRKLSLQDHHMIPSFRMSIGLIVCVAVVDCLIMLYFSVKLYQVLPPKPEKKKVEEIETNHNYAEDLTNHRLRRKYAQNGTNKTH